MVNGRWGEGSSQGMLPLLSRASAKLPQAAARLDHHSARLVGTHVHASHHIKSCASPARKATRDHSSEPPARAAGSRMGFWDGQGPNFLHDSEDPLDYVGCDIQSTLFSKHVLEPT